MRRLLVLNGGAAARPGNRGAVLSVPDPRAFFARAGINTGDLLVYDATLRALRYDEVRNLQFAEAGDPARWPETPPEATVIRGSNYLTPSLDLGHLVPLLRALPAPIVAMGVGAQAPRPGRVALTPGSREAWRIVADKSVSLGVRGAYSAEVLAGIGVTNLRLIGCPSFYRARRPRLSLRPPDPATARIGLTLNRHLSGEYASNQTKVSRLQRALLLSLARREGSRLYAQGEREEHLLSHAEGEEREALLSAILRAYGAEGDEAARGLVSRLAAHLDVEAWSADAAANLDAMMGFRLHGNVVALHQGLPAVAFTYDQRTRELADLFAVPRVEVEEFHPPEPRALLEAADFGRFSPAYAANYAEYRGFLDENGLAHDLPPAEPPEGEVGRSNPLRPRLPAGETLRWLREEHEHLARAHEGLRRHAETQRRALDEARRAP